LDVWGVGGAGWRRAGGGGGSSSNQQYVFVSHGNCIIEGVCYGLWLRRAS
jgi:hypothetical protein